MDLQLQIDRAHSFSSPLVGVKLDKSKCFDSLLPSLSAALMITFGLPAFLARGFFSLVYTNATFYFVQAMDSQMVCCKTVVSVCFVSIYTWLYGSSGSRSSPLLPFVLL